MDYLIEYEISQALGWAPPPSPHVPTGIQALPWWNSLPPAKNIRTLTVHYNKKAKEKGAREEFWNLSPSQLHIQGF